MPESARIRRTTALKRACGEGNSASTARATPPATCGAMSFGSRASSGYLQLFDLLRQSVGELPHGAREPEANIQTSGVGRQAEDIERGVRILHLVREEPLPRSAQERPDAIDRRGVLGRFLPGSV